MQRRTLMRGVTFLGERKLQLAEFPDPTPGPDEVVIEIKASGMCGSDLKFYRATGGGTPAPGGRQAPKPLPPRGPAPRGGIPARSKTGKSAAPGRRPRHGPPYY